MTPVWQPMAAHFAVKMGCTSSAKDTVVGMQTHAPPSQVSPGLHTLPQLPQLFVSVIGSAPPGQMQTPSSHVPPTPHEIPQSPQCSGSLVTSTQDWPHCVSEASHEFAQAPRLQTRIGGHM